MPSKRKGTKGQPGLGGCLRNESGGEAGLEGPQAPSKCYEGNLNIWPS